MSYQWGYGDVVIVRFQIVWQHNAYYWELMNPSGTPVARSSGTFATEKAATDAARHAQATISNAPIVPSGRAEPHRERQ